MVEIAIIDKVLGLQYMEEETCVSNITVKTDGCPTTVTDHCGPK